MRAGGGGGGRELKALVQCELGGGQQRLTLRGAERRGTARHEAGARSTLAQLLRQPSAQAALAARVAAAAQHHPREPTGPWLG